MSQPAPLPSEQECQAFARKLGEFRATLPASEQRMLDAVVMAAFSPAEQGDVQPYEWFSAPVEYVPPTSSPNPSWYHGSGAAAWNRTVWASVYLNIPLNPR